MNDLIFLLLTAGSFAVACLYVLGCDRLNVKAKP